MSEPRIIKRYANRKLYDTLHSRYVTLEQISEMIREGDEVRIVDNKSKEDLTSVTLAQIIFEEEKKQRSFLPMTAMRNIIQNGGEWFAEAQRRVTSILPFKGGQDDPANPAAVEEPLPEAAAGAAGAATGAATDPAAASAVTETAVAEPDGAVRAGDPAALRQIREWVNQSQRALDDWQKRVDGRIRHAVETISPFTALQKDVRTLADRIAELEARLGALAEQERRDGNRRS